MVTDRGGKGLEAFLKSSWKVLLKILRFSYDAGRRTVKVVTPSWLWAAMVPPWSSTISRAMASPSPAPPVREAREESRRKNCSKMRPSLSGGMVTPVLVKVRTVSPYSTWAAMATAVPASL